MFYSFHRALLVALLLTWATGTQAVAAEKQPAGERPNILWIISDDQGPDLGCYGVDLLRTLFMADLKADPHGLHNLADSPKHQEVLKELREALEKWLKETGDQGAFPEKPEARQR